MTGLEGLFTSIACPACGFREKCGLDHLISRLGEGFAWYFRRGGGWRAEGGEVGGAGGRGQMNGGVYGGWGE